MKKQCESCGTTEGKIRVSPKFDKTLCDSCYQSYCRSSFVHELPVYGETTQNEEGHYICHICGRAFKKLMSHAVQTHHLTEHEYKLKFGLYSSVGLCAPSTKEKLKKAVYKHYPVVIHKNLVIEGEETQFKKGSPGRTEVCQQLKNRLKTHFVSIGKPFKKGENK